MVEEIGKARKRMADVEEQVVLFILFIIVIVHYYNFKK